MLNAIALLLASSTSVKFQMLPHETNAEQYRIIVSPLLNDKALDIPPSKQTMAQGKTAAEVKASLITPFTMVGTVDELNEQLPIALAQMSEPRIEAKNNLDALMESLNSASTAKPSVKKTPTKAKAAAKTGTKVTQTAPTAQKEDTEKTSSPVVETQAVKTEKTAETTATNNDVQDKVEQVPVKAEETASTDQITFF